MNNVVWAWGSNNSGQLGDGTTTDRNIPVQVLNISHITAVAGGYTHSLALDSDGKVWAWGYNNDGELGNGTNMDSNVPVLVSKIKNISAVAAGWYHSLAISETSPTRGICIFY